MNTESLSKFNRTFIENSKYIFNLEYQEYLEADWRDYIIIYKEFNGNLINKLIEEISKKCNIDKISWFKDVVIIKSTNITVDSDYYSIIIETDYSLSNESIEFIINIINDNIYFKYVYFSNITN